MTISRTTARRSHALLGLGLFTLLASAACDDAGSPADGPCDSAANVSCEDGLVCELNSASSSGVCRDTCESADDCEDTHVCQLPTGGAKGEEVTGTCVPAP